MEKKNHSQKFLKKRKFLLIMPMLVIPFLSMAFYALGGGKGIATGKSEKKISEGLNLNLPSANLKEDKNADKLSFYENADKQERKKEETLKNDPYFKLEESEVEDSNVTNELEMIIQNSSGNYKPVITKSNKLNPSPVYSTDENDRTENKIQEKIKLLEREINKPQETGKRIEEPSNLNESSFPGDKFSTDVNRLESMMHLMNEKNQDDPEMQQLEGMLDKILDVQHPDRVKERMNSKTAQQKKEVYSVNKSHESLSISLLGDGLKNDTSPNNTSVSEVGFFGADNNAPNNDNESNSIEAAIHETQTLVNGSVIKLRLLNDIHIRGEVVPKDNFVFGIAALNGERLTIEINSIRYHNSIFPVKMQVYDLDGLEGVYIPGAISRDVAKQSGDNALQMMGMTTLDPSLAAQATSAGINTVKNLLSKKVKLIKVNVKAGYKVLLKDKSIN